MFEDQMKDNHNQAPSGQVPGNLPTGEPEDIFSAAEPASSPQPASVQSQPAVQAPDTMATPGSSALEAGVLQPKQASPAQPSPSQPLQPPADPMPSLQPQMTTPPVSMTQEGPAGVPPMQSNDIYTVKEPTTSRIVFIAIVSIVVVGLVGTFGYNYYKNNFTQSSEDDQPVEQLPIDTGDQEEIGFTDLDEVPEGLDEEDFDSVTSTDDGFPIATSTEDASATSTDELATSTQDILDTQDESILFGNVDPDEDGLDDLREADYGTDPLKWDTDEDELSDGDEVNRWKTDPLNPDSDGDGYLDGAEVRNGYSPLGNHKLPEPPPPPEAAQDPGIESTPTSTDRSSTTSTEGVLEEGETDQASSEEVLTEGTSTSTDQ